MSILAIDPGNTHSGYALINSTDRRPVHVGKVPNEQLATELRTGLSTHVEHIAIEMVASYGMAVGKEVFETCVWIGRYLELTGGTADLVYRREVKLHHCHSAK